MWLGNDTEPSTRTKGVSLESSSKGPHVVLKDKPLLGATKACLLPQGHLSRVISQIGSTIVCAMAKFRCAARLHQNCRSLFDVSHMPCACVHCTRSPLPNLGRWGGGFCMGCKNPLTPSGAYSGGQDAQNATSPGEDALPKYAPPPYFGPAAIHTHPHSPENNANRSPAHFGHTMVTTET